jgi:hypothetical protein
MGSFDSTASANVTKMLASCDKVLNKANGLVLPVKAVIQTFQVACLAVFFPGSNFEAEAR